MAKTTGTRHSGQLLNVNRRAFLLGASAAAGLILSDAVLHGETVKTVWAAPYDRSLEGAIIRRPWDGVCWWLQRGARHWIPDGTTYMAIHIDNGRRSYDWSDDRIEGVPEREAVASRIPAGDEAAQWALGRVGGEMDRGWCMRFCARAYGASRAGFNAIDAWNEWGRGSDFPTGNQLLPGMVVYFRANRGNGGYGHAGIYVGDGNFVSATEESGQSVRLYSVGFWDRERAE